MLLLFLAVLPIALRPVVFLENGNTSCLCDIIAHSQVLTKKFSSKADDK
jgi:DNA-directed RNA polymerase beta' subunit